MARPIDVMKDVQGKIKGRVATELPELILLSEMLEEFGGGSHLEIGVLFGGTMAFAGQTLYDKITSDKDVETGEELPLIVGIDPLDGYYVDNKDFGNLVDPISQVPVTPQVCIDNLNMFEFKYLLCCVKSEPFPIADYEFDTAYIDGDHWNGQPYRDFVNVSKCTKKAIMFDNVDVDHPDVMVAVSRAVLRDGWKVWNGSNHGVVLVRRE